MNESEIAINIKQKLRIILPNEEKKSFIKQNKNREYGIIIKYIYIISGDIPPFLIYKRKHIL